MEKAEVKSDEFADVAALLREEIEECHQSVMDIFTFSRRRDGNINYAVQMDAMKTATRLMQASATAANALKRLSGTRHTVSVDKPVGDTHPLKSKTNVPDAAQA
jgi:hypothetical protein